VLASPPYLEQTLRNLVSNAEKYSPPGTPIAIHGHVEGDAVVVNVLDDGPGIDGDEAASLFMPFYRSNATAHLAQGVGIGLAVCKRLIEAQEGEIWAVRRETGGSRFGFSLPVLVEDD